MGVDLVVVAEEFVEAMLLGNPAGAATADAPLAEAAGGVTLWFEHAGERGFIGADRSRATVGSHRGVSRVQTGEQDTAGRAADRGSGVGVGEAHAFTGEAVDIWSYEIGIAHVPGLEVAPFIEHEVDDIGLLFAGKGG